MNRYMFFSILLVVTSACGGDEKPTTVPDAGLVTDAATDTRVDLPDQEFGTEDANSDRCTVDDAMGAVVSTDRQSCDQLCASLNCSCTTGEHIAFGQIEGEARYAGGSANILRCEVVPPLDVQGIDGTVENFSEVECFCE